MRGRSYSPSPPPRGGYGRRGRSPSPPPRGRYGGGRSRGHDSPTSLLVRNLRHDCRVNDLRRPFEQFGPVKDIYLPRDYYTGEPRGFGFVQFLEPADAGEAKYQMDGEVFQGRQLTVVFAEENRKKPTEMRARERGSSGSRSSRHYDRRRSPVGRYSRSPQYSRSPPPRYGRARSRSPPPRDGGGYYSPPPKRRQYSRSISPQEKRYRERSYSRSPIRGDRSPPPPPYAAGSRSRSRSPVRGASPPYNGTRSRSRSPVRGPPPMRGPSRSPSRSRSRSPVGPAGYQGIPERDDSPYQ